jgi:small subunit ribosomal protein S35
MSDIPIDTRHIEAKNIKAGVGLRIPDYAGGRKRRTAPPSIKDFPREWLPTLPPQVKELKPLGRLRPTQRT